MDTVITAIGTAVPPYKQNQLLAAEIISRGLRLSPAETRLLKAVYKSSGIEYRYSVMPDFCREVGNYEFFPNDPNLPFPTTKERMQVYKNNALNLALNAVKDCVAKEDDNYLAKVTHLITVSCTGMYAPGIDIELTHQLNLNPQVKRTCINFMGCYGTFNAIKVADTICKADPTATVLIVSIEICTIHFQKELDNLISNAIFSDGAGALLLQAKSHSQAKKQLRLEAFHCDLLPQNSKDMAWHIADKGFDIVLSTYVPQAIESGIAEFTKHLLSQNKMTLTDIDIYAIHPGGQKILKACEQALALTPEHNKYSYQVLREFGNMSSATIIFVLKKIWEAISQQNHEDKIFSCAFGPGLTLESMLLIALVM